ncbi:hypothetical protein J1605_014777 [Eschrichtius robustus]|uniref:Uncharacterized protein n=1 Tax=Eschrichtius robustus TaxID=9764 RepID=A0AB34GG96_ESCRO|nr:hypothetical protein J1605_014777 [Eschrichtius robustus]
MPPPADGAGDPGARSSSARPCLLSQPSRSGLDNHGAGRKLRLCCVRCVATAAACAFRDLPNPRRRPELLALGSLSPPPERVRMRVR